MTRRAEASAAWGDLRGPADYKRSVVRTLTERTLAKAAERAG